MESQLYGLANNLTIKNSVICLECQKEISMNYDNNTAIPDALDTLKDITNLIYNVNMFRQDNSKGDKDRVVSLHEYANKKTLPKTNKMKYNSYDIYKRVTRKIIGQDNQVKEIIATLMRNGLTTDSYFKANMFLIGGTGTGKTKSIELILKELDIPYVIEAATTYTKEGYVGDSVEDALLRLIEAADGNIEKAERGVIVFDEIDKKTDTEEGSNVSTKCVQDSLLKMLEGTKFYTKKGVINTEFITFILSGSCEKVYEARKKRLRGKGTIGFTTQGNTDSELKNPNFIPQDLIEANFRDELVGRCGIFIEFNDLKENDLLRIMNTSEISIFNCYLRELNDINVDIVMKRDEIVSEIAKRASQLKDGARGINQVVNDMFRKIHSEVMVSDINPFDGYECYISKDTVYDNSKFRLCKKKRQN